MKKTGWILVAKSINMRVFWDSPPKSIESVVERDMYDKCRFKVKAFDGDRCHRLVIVGPGLRLRQ